MPPVHHLEKRLDPGVTFSFIFAAVASSVVLACAIWGFIIPKWRKSHPPSPSQTKWNDGSILTRRSGLRHFSSRHTIKPLLSKPSAAQILPTYDPRTESPFPRSSTPDTPGTPTYMDLPIRIHSASTMPQEPSSNGLFTPVRGSTYKLEPVDLCHTMPRGTDSKYFETKSVDYGDAKEFILAMPEPLLLRPRSTSRPYSATQHLEKYSSSQIVSLTGSDKIPHPKKLFQALQGIDQRSSLCSETSLRLDHRESDAVYAETQIAGALNQALKEDALRRKHMRQNSDDSVMTTTSAVSQDSTHSRMTSLHRAKSYKSLTGSRSSKLTRSGTNSRSKTPVLELKKLYSTGDAHDAEPMPKLPSTSTAVTMTTDSGSTSESEALSTPETPPSLARLPATTFGISIEKKPSRSVTQPEQADKIPLTNQGQLRIRVRASSLYSRDTNGYSLNNTPITLDFPSPVFDYFTGQELTHPYKGRESVKDKINHWNHWMDRENTLPVPLSSGTPAFAEQDIKVKDVTQPAADSIATATKDEKIASPEVVQIAPGGAVWI